MSERSKGDVSRVNNNANRVVKNPLLSASVTGLTFDDFPNKPVLLPAAPPVVHAPPPQPTSALIAGILNREPKTLVTVGQPSIIDDNETLDEINLNASSSDDSATANASSINLFQGTADANTNPLLEPPLAADSLLSQAASSFGALPSVASNVFSTFSKRIYAGARDTDEASSTQPQLDIQPTYIQQTNQAPPAAVAPAPFYAAPPTLFGEAAPEPPKFYAPTEVSSLGASALPVPPTSGGQNTYRISARKKLYAPIPGLSEQQQQPVPAATPFQTPPYSPQPTADAFNPPAPPPVQEERKSVGGLFSLTSLVPTGVLQNISGLVQSATGRSNEPSPPVLYPADSGGYIDISTSPAALPKPSTNWPAPTSATGYFAPTEAPPKVGGFFNPSIVAAIPESATPPTAGGFFTPATAVPAVAQPTPVSLPPTVSQQTSVALPPALVESTPAFGSASAVAGPPPAAGPTQSSYRLQKGTRLYKSPLTAQETAAPTAVAGQQTFTNLAAPAAIFNLFGGAQSAEVALFAPPPPAPIVAPVSREAPLFAAATPTSFFTPQTITGAELFQPAQAEESSAPAASLFAPVSAVTADSDQKVDLFPRSVAPQELSLSQTNTTSSYLTPQTQVTESNGSSVQPQKESLPAASIQEVPIYPQEPTAPLFTPQVAATPLDTNPPPESGQENTPTTALFTPEEQSGTSTKPEPSQEVLKIAAPPTAFVQEVSQGLALYPPAQIVPSSVPTNSDQGLVPASLPAPKAEARQGIDLYPPGPIGSVDVDTSVHSSTNEKLASPVAASAPQPIFTATSLFAPLTTAGTAQETIDSAALRTTAPGPTTGVLFAPPAQAGGAGTEQSSVALTTQTTTTFFNPFPQTVTTPLPQELLPPPIGFVAPSTQPNANVLFAAQTIEPVLPEAESVAALAPPPRPPSRKQSDASSQANPFRKHIESAATTSAAPSPLLSFFTPAANSTDCNFFGSPQEATQFPELPPASGIAPPALIEEPPLGDAVTRHSTQALGFEQLISDSQQATQHTQNSIGNNYQNSSLNTFSGYFGGTEEAAVPAAQPQPQPLTGFNSANFFDHFAAGGQGQEDQRIQNFFNNPPLQDQPAAPGELKYDLVHSGLPTKQFEQRSQTSVSNQVEPPSSACSEFSTAAPANPNPISANQPDRQAEYLRQLPQGELPEEILQQLTMANDKSVAIVPPVDAIVYTPVLPHWFYKRIVDGKFVWTPFSHYDSALLETSLNSDDADSLCIVPVEGGRYDVNIKERTKTPVFWEGKAIEVRRCSWFYKAGDGKYVPYAEQTAAALEAEYKRATESNEWHKKIPLANGEQVTMHGPSVIVHFMPPSNADTWGASVQSSTRPLVVKRDLNDFKIQQGESQRVDHLLFMVHGIGSACDLKMRNVEEVVDDFRNIAQQLVQSHYKNSTDMGLVGRVEVLPIEWHGHLHSEELGIDEKLKSITLESIPRLRNFTNDTLLDVLFYTSPKYCQKIMNTVADALNEVYLKYRMRHPEFNGGVSLAGHSLGSLILFDLLCHQEPLKESEEENKENPDQLPQKQGTELKLVQIPNNDQMLPKQVSYAMGMGMAGTGQPVINYTQLIFHPKKFFALGSPIGMFVTIRGIDKLGLDFRLPTCPGFYNIFHPFDPVAYRIEALVNPDMKGIRPVLIPHHKGRKRMHLELKETMTRVGADIKQRFMDTFKTTLDSVNFLATVTKVKKEAEESLEKEIHSSSSQVFQEPIESQDELSTTTTSTKGRNRTDSESTTTSDPEFVELDFPLGKLNDSKRVDYVLQEAPLEFINEYIFALSSHVCYWGSEDTILFVMKEIYAGLGISTDSQVPQQSMTIERPSSRNSSASQSLLPM
ncbi:nascent polypeptide-associated complex subunit alpha, muscle-specific form [Drosophila montana]|uniref:nascent polypeptide-associated complex subunit alpha, muscle-specific form n=1 Tax=Drosophila montana TaxID=40370 RepID=UPI00313C675B